MKVGEVQDQLGQLCCDVGLGSFEDDDEDEVLSDNNSIGIISHEGSTESRALCFTRLIEKDRGDGGFEGVKMPE